MTIANKTMLLLLAKSSIRLTDTALSIYLHIVTYIYDLQYM